MQCSSAIVIPILQMNTCRVSQEPTEEDHQSGTVKKEKDIYMVLSRTEKKKLPSLI